MWKILQGLTVLIALAALTAGAEAKKYKEVEVVDGGTIVVQGCGRCRQGRVRRLLDLQGPGCLRYRRA